MQVRTALLELFKAEPEYRRFFKACCEMSAFRLRSQAWQFWDELAKRGGTKTPRGGRPAETYPMVEDALMDLARELLPGTLAAHWDSDWAVRLCKDALARLGEHFARLSKADKEALDLSCQDPHDEAMVAAGLNNDPAAFRLALRGWEKAGREAIENLKNLKPEGAPGRRGQREREYGKTEGAGDARGEDRAQGCEGDPEPREGGPSPARREEGGQAH